MTELKGFVENCCEDIKPIKELGAVPSKGPDTRREGLLLSFVLSPEKAAHLVLIDNKGNAGAVRGCKWCAAPIKATLELIQQMKSLSVGVIVFL